MWLFRKGIDISRATARPSLDADLSPISRLLRNGGRRFYGLSGAELPGLVAEGLGAVLALGSEVWGAAVASWPVGTTAWLRGVALAEGVEPQAALQALLPVLHQSLAARGVKAIFYAGDDSAEGWLDPALKDSGYIASTKVVVYEKRDLLIPAGGNRALLVRTAVAADLAAVLELDRRCFEAQWAKDDTVLGTAIIQGPLFLVAELEGRIVGYIYATTHFSGHLVHLVRIAVDPALQGRGMGIRLLAEVIDFARGVGADVVTLNTQSYNLHAQRLYRWFGFRPTGERQHVLRYDLGGE
jgi:ribosomal-protein-alanine N-acetyltransferase